NPPVPIPRSGWAPNDVYASDHRRDRPLLDRPLELPTIVDSARPIVEPGTTTGTTIAATIKAAATNSSRRRARLVTADSAISVISPTTNAIVGPLDPAATSATNSAGNTATAASRTGKRVASRISPMA